MEAIIVMQQFINEKQSMCIVKQKLQQLADNMLTTVDKSRVNILIKSKQRHIQFIIQLLYELQTIMLDNIIPYTNLYKLLTDSINKELVLKISLFISKIKQNEVDIEIIENMSNPVEIEFLITMHILETNIFIKFLEFNFYDQIKALCDIDPQFAKLSNYHDNCNTLMSNCEFGMKMDLSVTNGDKGFPVTSERQYFEKP